MPKEWKYNSGSMLKTVESMQKVLKGKQFESLSENDKRELYASLFASRSAANAVRGKKKTLKVAADVNDWTTKRNELILSPSFQAFVTKQGHENMKKLLTEGHGGAAEKAFQDYVMEQSKLPTDVPERYMPTAEERIDQQKQKLAGADPRSDEAVAICAEIFRTRRAVNAVRKKADTLKSRVDGKALAKTEDLSANTVFRDFVKQQGSALKTAVEEGHGGAAEDLFKEHLLNLEHIPSGAPRDYMPTAEERLDQLKTKLKQGGTPAEQRQRCTEIMAAREAVNAVRKDSKSLAPQINPEKLAAAHEKWSQCASFQSFLKEKPELAYEGAVAGHGGKLQDAYKDYILRIDHIPADVPEGYAPTAVERLDAIREKYKAADYHSKSPEYKLDLAAEVMATREVVNAVRGDKDSLDKPIPPAQLQQAVAKWKGCSAFKEFVEQEPTLVRSSASDGHGGLLGDKFKEFVLKRDTLDADIPYGFMPNADKRLEALKQKIKDSTNPTPQQRLNQYAEMMATRSAVDAVRGKEKSLEKPIDPAILAQERNKLLKSDTFQRFVNDPSLSAELRTLAQQGHGGALEDKFKEYVVNLDKLPADLPARYMPTALDRTNALKKKIAAPDFASREDAAEIYMELMAAREAVNAVRSKEDSLKVTIEPGRFQSALNKWKSCSSFRDFVNDPDSGARKAAREGHGGALGDKFKEYVTRLEQLPTDLPEAMLPTALERIDGLKQNLREYTNPLFTEPDEYMAIYAQILAARVSVNAKKGDADSLKKRVDPEKLNEIAEKLKGSNAFHKFLNDNKELARSSAAEGHGGNLEAQFKDYIKSMNRLPEDVPAEFMPTAYERTEALKEKINSKAFKNASLDGKITLCAELFGARRAVDAVRKKDESLKTELLPGAANKEADKLIKCSAFREFIEKNPDLTVSGHGGELEDKFREYVLNMDYIPEDVPKAYMPTALKRTEALQKKIKSSEFRSYNEIKQAVLYKELIATRSAVDSARKNSKSLDATVDAKKLEEIRKTFRVSDDGPDRFLRSTDPKTREKLHDAAKEGHGGALEDLVKADCLRQTAEAGLLPQSVPDRYKPKAEEVREAIKKSIDSKKSIPTEQMTPEHLEQLKKQVAAMMYLSKLEQNAAKNGASVPPLDPTEMEKQTSALRSSKAFKDLFRGDELAKTRQNAAAGRMSNLFTQFNENKTRLDQQAQQRRQLQRQQAQNQHRPMVDEREQPEPVQRPNLQPDGEAQPRRRANSIHERQNPIHQL